MSKISRVTQKIFGSTAVAGQIAKFGSLAAGSPTFTTDPSLIQSLSNYLTGWFGAVIGGNSPAIEDMNAICFLYAYQLAYLMQAGVAEWDSGTTYYIGSICQYNGVQYQSLTDTNLNNTPGAVATYWTALAGRNVRTMSTSDNVLITDDVILCSAGLTATLPAAATARGKRFLIKNTGSGDVIVGAAANIDGAASLTLYGAEQKPSVEVFCDGSTYWII